MAVHGYLTHAAANRRRVVWLILLYVLGFEILGALAGTPFLLNYDPEHSVLADPLGYLLRYGLPVAALAGLTFVRLYRGHVRSVATRLAIRSVTRAEEPRFVDIAEAQCLALGIRLPRFGVIEAAEPNALAVGKGPRSGMIAVTRGLLDKLDDDELFAVCAHEASHIRLGDTRLLAVNHALMRTAVVLQTRNPLRIEDVRQMVIAFLLPPVFLLMLAGSVATMASMQLARLAQRGLRLSRDHIADGEAVRVTHYPEALMDAIRKVEGRSSFPGSYSVSGLLFDAPADHAGSQRASARSRLDAIATLGGEMMAPARSRRDTRIPSPSRPGSSRDELSRWRALVGPSGRFARDAEGRLLAQPPTPTLRMLWLRVSDPEAYREWAEACTDWWEWRVGDRRNMFGLTPKMALATAATAVLLFVVHRPADGDLRSYARVFSPMAMVEIARMMRADSGCGGASGHGNGCPAPSHAAVSGAVAPSIRHDIATPVAAMVPEPAFPSAPAAVMPMLLLGFVGLGLFRPKLLRRLFGQVD